MTITDLNRALELTREIGWTYEGEDCPQCRSNAVTPIRDAYHCKHCGSAWTVTDDGIEWLEGEA